MARPDKVAVVEEVRDKLRDADAAVLTEYRGLTVSELAHLRGTLRPSSTEYKVFKNSLARRAAEAAGLAELLPYLEGPVAIAFVHGDAVIAAKALRDFGRTNPALVIKGGLLGPQVLSGADVESLAEIEPRDVLLARLAGGFQAPLTKAAGLFQAFTRNLAYGVQAYIDQRVAAGEAAPTPTAPESEGADTTTAETTTAETTGAEAGPPAAADDAASPTATVDDTPSADADSNASETQDPATPDDAVSEEN